MLNVSAKSPERETLSTEQEARLDKIDPKGKLRAVNGTQADAYYVSLTKPSMESFRKKGSEHSPSKSQEEGRDPVDGSELESVDLTNTEAVAIDVSAQKSAAPGADDVKPLTEHATFGLFSKNHTKAIHCSIDVHEKLLTETDKAVQRIVKKALYTGKGKDVGEAVLRKDVGEEPRLQKQPDGSYKRTGATTNRERRLKHIDRAFHKLADPIAKALLSARQTVGHVDKHSYSTPTSTPAGQITYATDRDSMAAAAAAIVVANGSGVEGLTQTAAQAMAYPAVSVLVGGIGPYCATDAIISKHKISTKDLQSQYGLAESQAGAKKFVKRIGKGNLTREEAVALAASMVKNGKSRRNCHKGAKATLRAIDKASADKSISSRIERLRAKQVVNSHSKMDAMIGRDVVMAGVSDVYIAVKIALLELSKASSALLGIVGGPLKMITDGFEFKAARSSAKDLKLSKEAIKARLSVVEQLLTPNSVVNNEDGNSVPLTGMVDQLTHKYGVEKDSTEYKLYVDFLKSLEVHLHRQAALYPGMKQVLNLRSGTAAVGVTLGATATTFGIATAAGAVALAPATFGTSLAVAGAVVGATWIGTLIAQVSTAEAANRILKDESRFAAITQALDTPDALLDRLYPPEVKPAGKPVPKQIEVQVGDYVGSKTGSSKVYAKTRTLEDDPAKNFHVMASLMAHHLASDGCSPGFKEMMGEVLGKLGLDPVEALAHDIIISNAKDKIETSALLKDAIYAAAGANAPSDRPHPSAFFEPFTDHLRATLALGNDVSVDWQKELERPHADKAKLFKRMEESLFIKHVDKASFLEAMAQLKRNFDNPAVTGKDFKGESSFVALLLEFADHCNPAPRTLQELQLHVPSQPPQSDFLKDRIEAMKKGTKNFDDALKTEGKVTMSQAGGAGAKDIVSAILRAAYRMRDLPLQESALTDLVKGFVKDVPGLDETTMPDQKQMQVLCGRIKDTLGFVPRITCVTPGDGAGKPGEDAIKPLFIFEPKVKSRDKDKIVNVEIAFGHEGTFDFEAIVPAAGASAAVGAPAGAVPVGA